MKKTILKELNKEKKVMINFRATESEKKLLEEKAEKFAGGNLTQLIKWAVIKLQPTKNDLVTIED